MSDKINIQILVAPLDWGLGHATRCMPLISELINLGCKVIIAADGAQENLLKTEFPDLAFVNLPGYRVKYSHSKRFFSLKIIFQLPVILLAMRRENRWLKNFLIHTPLDAVISDNRYGLYNQKVASVFITHQLMVKAASRLLEQMMQRINYRFLAKFNRCWVPDESSQINMAGSLSHPKRLPPIPTEYLGGLSRLSKSANSKNVYDLLVILSGPEPQRSILEEKIMTELASYKGRAIVVRGLPGQDKVITANDNITIKNHLPAKEMEEVFSISEMVISRSGYTTVMDICKLQKKAVLIPTPGQTEQEYLATHLYKQGWCLWMTQDEFSLEKMQQLLQNFEYRLPRLPMENYKQVVRKFVENLRLE